MSENESALLMVMTIILALAGAAVTVFIVLEIIEIGRGVFANIREDLRYSRSAIVPPERQVTPFQDRKTVERVIDHLEEGKEEK